MVDGSADSTERFDLRYGFVDAPVMRRMELEALGSDYGATSYTTIEQADGLVQSLALTSNSELLDVGTGTGWPGIYLAAASGCNVTLTDVSLVGLGTARRRLIVDGARGHVVAASAGQLPFRSERFDAATSSDVFC